MEENIAFNNVNVNENTPAKIRRSFRTRMSGPTSQSMREKGLDYHVNWGIALPHLMEMAKDYQPDMHVAIELWKDRVRESKIMALLLMPKEEFSADLAMLWTETLLTPEMAEMAAMLLYQHMPYAPQLAYRLMASGDTLQQILAYNTLARLFMRDLIPDERGLNEFVDQATMVLSDKSSDGLLRHAVHNSIQKLAFAQDGLYEPVLTHLLQ